MTREAFRRVALQHVRALPIATVLALVLTHAAAIWSAAATHRANHPDRQAIAPTAPPSPAQSAAPTSVPRVRLVATGGTISDRSPARLTADELVASIPEVTAYARVEAEQFANVASAEMTLDQWLTLARRLNRLFEDERLAGLVVTCGTDTLEELAYFLHLTVRSDRPVVIVGAMRRPGTPGYEGQANLLAGFRVAADPQSRGRGALVVLNDEILSAREATKTDAQRLDTFQTRGYGVLGVVDLDRVVYYRDVLKRHTAKSEFEVQAIASLPRVDVLLTYQGAPGDLIRAAVDQGARGIVIATAAGGTSGLQDEGIRYAIDKQVVVVRTTRTGAGRVRITGSSAGPRPAITETPQDNGRPATPATPSANDSAVARGAAVATRGGGLAHQTIAGEDLAPIKARVLLMLALTKTSDRKEIQRMFLEY
jgi:L-asparaginase